MFKKGYDKLYNITNGRFMKLDKDTDLEAGKCYVIHGTTYHVVYIGPESGTVLLHDMDHPFEKRSAEDYMKELEEMRERKDAV